MKILLTGSQGFIGRALVQKLARDHEIFAVLRRAAMSVHPNVFPLIRDLSDREWCRGLPAEIDCVIHCAQSSRFRDWPASADDMFCVNVAATQFLLDYARGAGAQHFVLASTGSVYSPSGVPQAEDAITAPTGYYASSKLAAENLIRPYEEFFPCSALRLFFPYGPGQTDRLVSDLINRVATNRAITLKGGAEGFQFNPTYLDDVTTVISKALTDKWRGIVNVAAPHVISLREAGHIIGVALKKEPVFEVSPGPMQLPILPVLDQLRIRFPSHQFCSFLEGVKATLAFQGD